ncbi:hypothetical protein DTO063F5_6285 [Paecilomyces variotii]|nr:hypothetical protein DTO063F5_6285 [Paecilomyces variotii]
MAEARGYRVAFGGEGSESEDGGHAIPAPALKRRRYLVVADTDDESSENDESGLLAPVGAAVDARDEVSQKDPETRSAPPPSNEDLDAILAIDVDIEDEAGDEEYFSSPGDDPADEIQEVCDMVVTKFTDTTQFSTVFLEIFRTVLVALVDFAKRENVKSQ